jgi:hypothetical protein
MIHQHWQTSLIWGEACQLKPTQSITISCMHGEYVQMDQTRQSTKRSSKSESEGDFSAAIEVESRHPCHLGRSRELGLLFHALGTALEL